MQFCASQLPWIFCYSRGAKLPAWHWEKGGCFPHWEVAAQIWKTEASTNPRGFSSCFPSLQPQLCGGAFPPQSSTGSSGSPQPRSNDSEKRNKVGAGTWEWRSLLAASGSPALDLGRLSVVLPSRDLLGTSITNTLLPFVLCPILKCGETGAQSLSFFKPERGKQ